MRCRPALRARQALAGSPWRWRQPALQRSIHGSHHAAAAAATVFSGIQPTGIPHLGNYLGALRQWVRLQDAALPGQRLVFCIADLHAITTTLAESHLPRARRQTLAMLLAIGLDPERCTIFYQSAVSLLFPAPRLRQQRECMWLIWIGGTDC